MKASALSDPDAVRAAAVASIGAASRLEDSITALRQILPDNADAAEMARLVESVKAPRMQVVVAARKRESAQALELLAGIAEPLKRIDELSSAIQQAQVEERASRAAVRQAEFQKMVLALLCASAGGVVLGLLFYWRLMKRLARTDEVERLLGEVHHSAQQLDSDGRQLSQLNADMRRSNVDGRLVGWRRRRVRRRPTYGGAKGQGLLGEEAQREGRRFGEVPQR